MTGVTWGWCRQVLTPARASCGRSLQTQAASSGTCASERPPVLSKTGLGHGSQFLPGIPECSVLLESDQAPVSSVASGTVEAWPQGLDSGKEAPLTSPSSRGLPPLVCCPDGRVLCVSPRESAFLHCAAPPGPEVLTLGSPPPFQVDTLCLEDLHAFIAQALCLQGKSAGQLMDLQVLV